MKKKKLLAPTPCACGECLPGQIGLCDSPIKTFASLFTGGGLADIGARAAGLEGLWGIELEPEIAGVAAANGVRIGCGDVREMNKSGFDWNEHPAPDWLHMSPPCTNASQAKADAGETPLDLELARACCAAIAALRPRRVSLENVYYYRTFESFALICAELVRLGYDLRAWHLNAADYGVPQTRKRLILVASLDGAPNRPAATHTGNPAPGFFEGLPPWVGWYESITDLIPDLPESAFADWQITRLEEMQVSQLVGNQSNRDGAPDLREPGEPAVTVCAGDRNKLRAFVVHPTESRDLMVRDDAEPSFTVMATHGRQSWKPRAFIADGQQATKHNLTRPGSDPAFTVTASAGSRPSHLPKAFLANGQDKNAYNATSEKHGKMVCIRDAASPAPTVRTTGGRSKAFLASGADSPHFRERGELMVRDETDPAATVTAGHDRHPARAWLESGRTVTMTPRCLARFQSVPDDYQMPEAPGLAVRIIGNGVPCLLMQRIIEANK